jgi:Domain of unknown function (DUF4350)
VSPAATLLPTATATSPTLRETARRWRGPVFGAAAILAVAVLLAVVAGTSRRGFLDPQAVDPQGSRAVVNLLRSEGVEVVEARTVERAAAASGPETTLLVTSPDLLSASAVPVVRATGAALVLVAPTVSLARLAGDVQPAGRVPAGSRTPGCAVPAAERAGRVPVDGTGYAGGTRRCYDGSGGAWLVVARGRAGAGVVVLGDAAPLTNAGLAEDGAAALALGLLGAQPRLVWFRPTLGDLGEDGSSLTALLPPQVAPTAAMVGVAVVLLALWRARRLGPLVAEPLPVVVRAAEATEGRARLYRRTGARDRAAAALRQAATARLAGRTGLPRTASSTEVVAVVAARTSRPVAEVAAALDGPLPPDDAALVRLAATLDALEDEVAHR